MRKYILSVVHWQSQEFFIILIFSLPELPPFLSWERWHQVRQWRWWLERFSLPPQRLYAGCFLTPQPACSWSQGHWWGRRKLQFHWQQLWQSGFSQYQGDHTAKYHAEAAQQNHHLKILKIWIQSIFKYTEYPQTAGYLFAHFHHCNNKISQISWDGNRKRIKSAASTKWHL